MTTIVRAQDRDGFAARMFRRGARVATLAVTAWLAGCGGWSDAEPTTEIRGVAATGAAIANAEVDVVLANGERVTTRTDAAGRFAVQVIDLPPFLVSVRDGEGRTWYSYAAAGGTAHVTPLTTLALLHANDDRPLDALPRTWSTLPLGAQAVLDGARQVNANLRALMTQAGVDAASINVFTAADFAADGRGLDAVLDAIRVSTTCTPTACSRSITSPSGSVLVSWRGDLATTGLTVSWSSSGGAAGAGTTTGAGTGAGAGSTTGTATGTSPGSTTGSGSGTVSAAIGSCTAPVPGTWSMIVRTAVAGLGAVPVPEVCVDGLAGPPASESEFCGGAGVRAQLPPGVEIVQCRYAGGTGTIAARIATPIGAIDYTVTYTFVRR